MQVQTQTNADLQARAATINTFLTAIAHSTNNKYCANDNALSQFEFCRAGELKFRSAFTGIRTKTNGVATWANLGRDRDIIDLLRGCAAHIQNGRAIDAKDAWEIGKGPGRHAGLPVQLAQRFGKNASVEIKDAAFRLGLLL